jgi:hypothetical protein
VFIAHYGLGFAAHRAAPRVHLHELLFAAQLPDLLWPLLLLCGWEQVRLAPGATAVTPLEFVSYPWSHSLLTVSICGLLLGGWQLRRRRGTAAAATVAALPLGHWLLDALSHAPDLPLVPWGDVKIGLLLWNHPAASFAVEALLFAAGLTLYARSTRPRTALGTHLLTWFGVFLAAIYTVSFFGPPPPDTGPVIISGLAQWLFLLPAWLIDRNRTAL